MGKVISRDGTLIAFERTGKGPAILVDGALSYRDVGPMKPLTRFPEPHFTVFSYDRRGRGESGDTAPYEVRREVEDIEALINEAGGSVMMFGNSSGAALILEAATHLKGITKLALYEAPFIVDSSHAPRPEDYLARMEGLIASNRRSDAVTLFLETVGLPSFAIVMMRFMPVWRKLTAIAHTLPYDFTILGDTGSGKPLRPDRWTVTVPALLIAGGKSPFWMRRAMQALADILPHARYITLAGQTHNLKPEVLGPELVKFFESEKPA